MQLTTYIATAVLSLAALASAAPAPATEPAQLMPSRQATTAVVRVWYRDTSTEDQPQLIPVDMPTQKNCYSLGVRQSSLKRVQLDNLNSTYECRIYPTKNGGCPLDACTGTGNYFVFRGLNGPYDNPVLPNGQVPGTVQTCIACSQY